MLTPRDLKYSQDHTWVKVDGNRATIGITDFAQSWIGNLESIDIFEEGTEIEQLGLFGILETSKVSFELYSPVGGKITKRNERLINQITLINQEPYKEGWMIVLRMKDKQDLTKLMDAETYKKYIKRWIDPEGNA
jgi:glycine cleavage system H protein